MENNVRLTAEECYE